MIFAQHAIVVVIQMVNGVFGCVFFFFPGEFIKLPPSDRPSAPSLFPTNVPSLAV